MSDTPLTPTRQPAAMVLAAGRGERMRPLTDHTPKPLLTVHGVPLLEATLRRMAHCGIDQAIVNTGWLGEQIATHFAQRTEGGNGLPALTFSHEVRDFGHALETAGGIARALPWLRQADSRDIFWLAAGDVYAPDFDFAATAVQRFANSDDLAHLWLVPNPEHNPRGDFALDDHGRVWLPEPAATPARPCHTYSTIALLRGTLFEPPWCELGIGNPQGVAAPLAPLLRRAIAAGRVGGTLYPGAWTDVGTPQRLAALQ